MPLSLGFVLGDDDESEHGLDDLDVSETLAAAGDNRRESHRTDVRGLEIDLHFAALHSEDPHDERLGGNKLVQLGGDGTPMVQDLPLCELAIARGVHELSARSRISDAPDLAFRLPGYWGGLRSGRGHVWVGRRIARMSRHLDREQVRIVDAAVSDVIALLNGTYGLDDDSETADPEPARVQRPQVVLHAHISQAAVDARLAGCGDGVVVRVEELGPILLESFLALTGRDDLTVKPVIDLNAGRSVNQYEHPLDVKERGLLRTTGDVFPHAQTRSRALDNDHPDPYDKNGPPGQTGDHNHAPLGRRHHRAKTHLGYRVTQIGPNRYLWRTPHGLWRLVDGSGTHVVTQE